MYRYHILDSNGHVVECFNKFTDMISYAIEFHLDDTYKLERIGYVQSNTISVYGVFDNTGHQIRGGYKNKLDALNYCIIHNRPDWTVKETGYLGK